jgi:hypothetical protein
MKSLSVSRLGLCLAAAVSILGCGGSNREAPKIPLNQAQAGSMGSSATGGSTTPPEMGSEAKAALDSGNVLYRAKSYDAALVQYRRAAELSPTESAPLVGIMMVADVTKNTKLADSTLVRIRALSPGAGDASAAMSQAEIREIHAGIKKGPALPDAKK